jgi:ferredoxin
VQLPKIARQEQVSGSGTGSEQAETMVLVRTGEGPGPSERGGLIYPALGRNGLNFKPDLCTSCGLCVFICPTKAITTPATKDGYQRIFDMGKCVYCGLCESACPTQAILLTVEQHPAKLESSALLISGEVKTDKCPKCGAKPPKANLLAARIYEMANEPKICEECAKRVQKAEETVCE